MVKKIGLFLVVFVFFFASAHAGRRFDDLVKAIQEKYIQIRLEEVEKKYKNQNIEGRAYIINISSDVSGRKTVTLSTEEDRLHPKAVTIVVYLRKYYDKDMSRFKVGDRVHCFGSFSGFRMNTIVIGEGFIK